MPPTPPLAQSFISKPTILPGESISGYIARVSPFAVQGGIDMTLRYQNKVGQRLPWLLPSGLQQLAKLYGPSVPSAEALLDNHTLFPLIRLFLPQDVCTLLSGHFLEKSVPGVVTTCGLSSPGFSNRWALAICPQCIVDDGKHGPTYWRTAHFIPGIALCPFHLEPLFTYCNRCEFGFRQSKKVWQPTLQCLCGAPLRQVRRLTGEIERKVETSVVKLVSQILTEKALSHVGYNEILSAISQRAQKLGHGGPYGVIRIKTIIEKKFGAKTLNVYRFSTNSNSVFRQTLAGACLPRNPLHNLLLINALFDGVQDLKDSISLNPETLRHSYLIQEKNKTVLRRKRPDRYRKWYEKTEREIHDLRSQFRNKLLELKIKFPNITRNELKSSGANDAYAFFLRFDKIWFDNVLPCRPKIPTSTENCNNQYARRDSLIAAHVRSRHKLLIRLPSPIRITHRRLLEGQSRQSIAKKHLAKLPNTSLALAECTESAEEWRLRQLQGLLAQVFAISPDAPFLRDVEIIHLSYRQIKRLKEKIRKWLKKQI